MARAKNFIDITGQRFDRLTAIERGESSPCGQTRWVCRCDCGNVVTVQYSNLKSGATKSCGCLNRDNLLARNTKHGGHKRSRTERLYRVWHGMRERCYEKGNISFQYYGAKGVTVCEEWRNNYQAFREWALSAGYDAAAERGKCTLDRIDPFGNYEPGNCRWVSMYEQNHNRRRDAL